MYTKEDVIKFGTYLLSEERTKKIEFAFGANPERGNSLKAELLTVTEADFDTVWPPIKHELTQEDLNVNGPIADAEGNQLQAGDIVEVPTTPDGPVEA